MNRKNEIYIGVGDFHPYMFYCHLVVDTFEDNYSMLYENVNKYKENSIVFIFEIYCDLSEDDILVLGYDFICLCRNYELHTPSYDDIEKTIKDILKYEYLNDSLFYNIEEKMFYILNDEELINITISMLRSLKNPNNIKVIKI